MNQASNELDESSPTQDNANDNSFSIDKIKGVVSQEEEKTKRKPRKEKEPKEKLTAYHLANEKGVSLLIRKGRQLNEKRYHSIKQKSDAIMTMYHEWVKGVYGLDQFEDVLSKIQDVSQHETIRSLMDSYREAELQKGNGGVIENTVQLSNSVLPIESLTTNQS